MNLKKVPSVMRKASKITKPVGNRLALLFYMNTCITLQ